MIKFICIFIFLNHCFAFSQQSTKTSYSVLKSTINSVSSTNIYLTKNKFNILQSIGQSGIIGTKNRNLISVQQGFLNNVIYFKVNNTTIKNNFKETLDFVISPNPFIDYIKIDFSKKTLHDIYVRIYDVNGKTFYSKKYVPTDKITIQINNRLSIGTYLIQIMSGSSSSTNKILKIE